jgi:hypothetical protein
LHTAIFNVKVSAFSINYNEKKTFPMRKIILFILFLPVISTLAVKAQVVVNKTVLNNMSRDILVREKNNYNKAAQLAVQKGWFLRKVTSKGKVITLVGIDHFGNPRYLATFNNTIAAATTRANQLWPGGSSGLNLSGSSDAVKGKLAIWDGGHPLTTHVELVGRVLVKDSSALDNHATHTSGTLIATGVNPVAKGMAFGAQQLISYDYNNDQSEMSQEASNLLLSNHSYGYTAGWYYDGTNYDWYGDTTISKSESYGFGYYDQSAQVYDSIAYNAPDYLISMSAGNPRGEDGPAVGGTYYYNGSTTAKARRTATMTANPDYGSVAYTQTAKNILCVGAVNGIPAGYNVPTDVVMSSFSAWGPTDDGRIKPDVVADGVNVTSSWGTSNTAYATEDGTSMAAPNATGSLYLLQEYYKKLHPSAFMRSATLKGLAIHTADEAGSYPGPDYQFGWGLLNVLKASEVITSSYQQQSDTIIESTLNNGNTYTFTATASGKGSLVATLVWTDPPAIADTINVLNNPAPRLINDLDMRITHGGQVYQPWILDPAHPANAATKGDNYLDNVEKITVDSVLPGQTYTLTISHKGTLQRGSQAFSLLVSGIGGTAYCVSGATSSAGTRIDSVAFGGITNKNTTSCTQYSNFTNLTAQIQPSQTLPLTVALNSCDASTNSRVVKVYIDYNENGSFTDSGELVATSGVITGGSKTFTTSITTPAGLTAGDFALMRIVAEETTDTSVVKPCGYYANGETQDYRVQFTSPSNDLTVTGVSVPLSSSCADTAQLVQINIQNKGSVDQPAVPLTAVIKNGNTTVAVLTGIYPLLSAGSSASYTFQVPFTSVAATTYTITAYSAAVNDQNRSNDTLTTTITTAAKPANPTGFAEICGNTVYLRATNSNPSASYFWYDTSLPAPAWETGTTVNTSVIASTYYLGTGTEGNVGVTSKNKFTSVSAVTEGSGGYQVGGNYLSYTATVSSVLESARLFTRRYGTITFYTVDFDASGNSTNIYDTKTIDVYPTDPNYLTDGANVNDPADTGAVFYIGLNLTSGSHSIYVLASDTLLFRNNNLTGNPYPFSIPNVISITGNSATSTTSSTLYQSYYYYLYNMKISTADCISDRVAIVPLTPPVPVISLVGDSLVSSITSGVLQWYSDDSAGIIIPGATGAAYRPLKYGKYYVTVTDTLGCQKTSADYDYSVNTVTGNNNSGIRLTVYPNPANSVLNVNFVINTTADIGIELMSASGQICLSQSYSHFNGQFNQQFDVSHLAGGIYILKVLNGSAVYRQKVVVIH